MVKILSQNIHLLLTLFFFFVIVEWSLKGKYIAVARENILHILSSKFREKLHISLPLKSWIGDSEENFCVKGIFLFIFRLLWGKNILPHGNM